MWYDEFSLTNMDFNDKFGINNIVNDGVFCAHQKIDSLKTRFCYKIVSDLNETRVGIRDT